MFCTRRSLISGARATATFYTMPPRVSAMSEKGRLHINIHERFRVLNQRDLNSVRKIKTQEVLEWEAVESNTAFKEFLGSRGFNNNAILDELAYMTAFCQKPLSTARKVLTRTKLLELYDMCQNEEEKNHIVSIMSYFDLFE